jgi:hypothetical protein
LKILRKNGKNDARNSDAIFCAHLLLLPISLALISCAGMSPYFSDPKGSVAPNVVVTKLNGESQAIQYPDDKETVFLFWDLVCARSSNLLPEIADLLGNKKVRQRFRLVVVNLDGTDSLSEVKNRLKDLNFPPDAILTMSGNKYQDNAYQAFSGKSIPYIVVVGKSGSSVTLATSRLDKLEEYIGE